MKRIQQGFTLIELMIVVAIVGILAAIALPAYQDYIVRSKMSEAVAAVGSCKTSVAEWAATNSALPGASLGGCSDTPSQYVASGGGWTGAAVIYTSQNTGAVGGECSLTLIPSALSGSMAIETWTGTFGGCAAKYVPASFRN